MAIGLNRGRMFFFQGDAAPTDPRAGFLHSAQGQQRLISFANSGTVFARFADGDDVTVIKVTGQLAGSSDQSNVIIVQRYDQLPDPSDTLVGTLGAVTADPVDAKNGLHVVMGGPPGSTGQFWVAAS